MSLTRPPLIPTTPKKSSNVKAAKSKQPAIVAATPEDDSRAAITTVGCSKRMSVTLEDGVVVIRMPLQTMPTVSSTGKSKLYCTTRGPRRVVQKNKDNTYTPVEIDGGVLKAIASAFVTLAPADGAPNKRTIIKKKKP